MEHWRQFYRAGDRMQGHLQSAAMVQAHTKYRQSHCLFRHTAHIMLEHPQTTVMLPQEEGSYCVRNIRLADASMFDAIVEFQLVVGGDTVSAVPVAVLPTLRKLYGITDEAVVPFHMTSGADMFLPSTFWLQQKVTVIWKQGAAHTDPLRFLLDVFDPAFIPIEHCYLLNNLQVVFPALKLSGDLKKHVHSFLVPCRTEEHTEEYNWLTIQCNGGNHQQFTTDSTELPLWFCLPTSHILVESPKQLENFQLCFTMADDWVDVDYDQLSAGVYTIYLTKDRQLVSATNCGVNFSIVQKCFLRFRVIDFDTSFGVGIWNICANIARHRDGCMGLKYTT